MLNSRRVHDLLDGLVAMLDYSWSCCLYSYVVIHEWQCDKLVLALKLSHSC